MPSALSSLEKQDLRHAVLYVFANRPGADLVPGQVRQSVLRLLPFPATVADVAEAIAFHASLGHVAEELDQWGSETIYKITAQGTLAYERDKNKIA